MIKQGKLTPCEVETRHKSFKNKSLDDLKKEWCYPQSELDAVKDRVLVCMELKPEYAHTARSNELIQPDLWKKLNAVNPVVTLACIGGKHAEYEVSIGVLVSKVIENPHEILAEMDRVITDDHCYWLENALESFCVDDDEANSAEKELQHFINGIDYRGFSPFLGFNKNT